MPTRVVFWILLSIAVSATPGQGGTGVDSLLAGAPCAAEARRQLEIWDVRVASAIRDPDGPGQERGVRLPTAALGTWVRLRVAHRGTVTVTRVDAVGMDTRRFDSDCKRPQVIRHAHRALERTLTDFTDAALRTVLAREDAGVILAWSPHMPLSVDAVQVLQRLTADLGLAFLPVLDPLATYAYAREVATSLRMPAAALQTMASVELAFRGMTTHAPAVQLFADGALVGSVVFGYRDEPSYRHLLESLAARR